MCLGRFDAKMGAVNRHQFPKVGSLARADSLLPMVVGHVWWQVSERRKRIPLTVGKNDSFAVLRVFVYEEGHIHQYWEELRRTKNTGHHQQLWTTRTIGRKVTDVC